MAVDPRGRPETFETTAAELRRLLDATDEGIVRLDDRGACVYVNRAAATMLGYSPERLLGVALHEAIHAHHADGSPYPVAACPIQQTLVSGLSTRRDDEVFWCAEGSPLPVEYSAAPIWDGSRVAGAVVTFRDNSERRNAELERQRLLGELQVQQVRLRAILQQMPAGVVIVDARTGRLILHNEQATTLLRQPLLDEDLADLHRRWQAFDAAGERLDEDGWPLAEAIRDGREVRERELRLRRVDGTVVWLSASAAPVRDALGEVVAAVVTFNDIDGRKRSEERLRFLSRASELLAGSLDYEVTLRQVANLAVPVAGDWCFVDLLEESDLRRVAVATNDPGQEELAGEFRLRYRPLRDAPHGISVVVRTGRPELVPEVTGAYLRSVAAGDAHLHAMHDLDITSVICVPLIARGRPLGALTLLSTQSRRRFDQSDLSFAEDLARRAAAAIDNAQLYRESEEHVNRLNGLVAISRAVAEAGLDLPRALSTVVEEAAEVIGDGSVLRLIDAGGDWLQTQASYHTRPELRAPLAEVTTAPLSTSEGLHAIVVRTRDAFLVPELTAEHYAAVANDFAPYASRGGLHSLLMVPLRIGDRVIGTLAVTRDVTPVPFSYADQVFLQELADRAALAIENARLYQEAQAALHAREEFLSIASHELRTPLTTIKGYSQMLVRQLQRPDATPATVESSARRVIGHVQRLEELVDDLLDISRVQQGQLALRPEPADLSVLAREVVERLAGAAGRGTRHEFVVDAPAPVTGVWDIGRLDQVLTNLISNAVKYSPDGGTVQVSVRDDAEYAELAVVDEGIGIAPELQSQLFQPFSRLANGAARVGGTGLGLYICRQIVERHGGSIAVASRPGEGSTFTVRLPRDPAAASVHLDV